MTIDLRSEVLELAVMLCGGHFNRLLRFYGFEIVLYGCYDNNALGI